MKKILAMILSIALVLTITIPAFGVSSVAVKSIKFNVNKITLNVGVSSNLKVTFTPGETTQKLLTYTTSNKNVVLVDGDGKITAINTGNATITAYTSNKAVFSTCYVSVFAASGNTIKIGVLTDVSSGAAATIKWATDGAILAVQQANKAGGINGKKIELVFRDTASDSANVAQKATELKAQGVVAILGPKSDGEAPAGAQWAEMNKFPIVTPSTLSTRVTISNASRYVFSCGFNAWAIGRSIAKEALKKGYKSAFFIGQDGGAPADVRDVFFREAIAANPSFVKLGSSQVSASSTEFSNIISSIVGKKPDMLVGAIAGPNFVSLVKQGNSFGLFNTCSYYGWYTTDSSNTSALGKDYPVGHVQGITSWPFWRDDIKGSSEMVADYIAIGVQEKAAVLPADLGLLWYMGIKSIVEALKTTTDYSSEGITTALTKVNFSTPYGSNIHFRDFDHAMTFPYYYVNTGWTTGWNIPVGVDVIQYGEELLPTKVEMTAYAKKLGIKLKDLSLLN